MDDIQPGTERMLLRLLRQEVSRIIQRDGHDDNVARLGTERPSAKAKVWKIRQHVLS